MPDNQQRLRDTLDCYRQVFATDAGKMVLKDLETRCGLYNCTFDPTSAHISAFNEGQRNVLIYIRRMLEMKPDSLPREGGFINGTTG